MQRTNIYLDDSQVRALKHLAAEEQASVAELVQRAIDEFLNRQFRDGADWSQRLDALVREIRGRMPADLTPEHIEADITAARNEVRALHCDARARGD